MHLKFRLLTIAIVEIMPGVRTDPASTKRNT